MLLQLLKEAPRDLVTPPKRLSVARSPGTVCALFALVRAVHAGMLVHVLPQAWCRPRRRSCRRCSST